MLRISPDRLLLIFLTISMISAYPAQMYTGFAMKLLSGPFLETSNAQLDNANTIEDNNHGNNGNTIEDNNHGNDKESKVENGESPTEQEVTAEKEEVAEPTEQEVTAEKEESTQLTTTGPTAEVTEPTAEV